MGSSAEEAHPQFLDKVIKFCDNTSYELLNPLTSYRSCHDGTPQEARIVFLCKRTGSAFSEEYIMKVKVQLPAQGQDPGEGPSTTTVHELEALAKFRDVQATFAPQLVAFHQTKQDSRGPFPNGFLTFTVMTKIAGKALFGKYWNMPQAERNEIVPKALEALKSIYTLGIEPVDRGLRNVIWHPESKHCGIIDFELWNKTSEVFTDDKRELQRWGLLQTPPAKDHWAAWNQMYR